MPDAINTATFPGDNISPEAIETAAASIRFVGSEVSSQGVTVVSAWHKLSGSYQAPESGDLLAAMDPVKSDAAVFGTLLGRAATALETFADEARTIRAALAAIRTEANSFLADIKDGVEKKTLVAHAGMVTENVDWDEDQDSVDKNNALIAKVNAQQVLLWAAERKCANAIYDLTGHAHIEAASAANCGQGYGVDEIPADAKMPWGAAVKRTEHCGEKVADSVGHFVWDGVVVGFGGGTVQGLGALLGVNIPSWKVWDWSWSASTLGGAWKGLGMTVVGAATTSPAGLLLAQAPGPVGSFVRDSQNSLKDTLKGIVAADKWGDDPAAAAGETTANILALIIPVGVAADSARAGGVAAKAGTSAARDALRVAGKAVDVTDPVYLASQAVRFAGKNAGLSVDALRGLLKTADLTDSLDLNIDVGKLDVVPSVSHDHLDIDQPSGHTNHSDAPPARDHSGNPSEGQTDTSGQRANGDDTAGNSGAKHDAGTSDPAHASPTDPSSPGHDAGGTSDGTPSGDGGRDPSTGAGPTDPATGHPSTPTHSPTPLNDPSLAKSDPAVASQVNVVRSQIGPELQAQADAAWAHAEARAQANGLAPTPQRVGSYAHKDLAEWLDTNGNQLVDPDSGYRVRPEVSFDASGAERPSGTKDTIRPDIVIEREVIDPTTQARGWQVVQVIDLKTGEAGISKAWEQKVQAFLSPLGPSETLRPVK